MAAKKYTLIKLVSTADTGYFFVKKVNPKKMKEKKLSFKKYDPKVRKHVEFKQQKLSS